MGMRIGQSIPGISMTAMSKTSRVISRSLQRLSSGKQINSPRDGSASFSLGINLDSQLRGLRLGTLNINSAQSMLMTADSALQSQLDLVQRMRELALQASNGTLSTSDRQNLNTELQGLLDEYQRLTTATEFNGSNLIDGSTLTRTIQVGANKGQGIDLRFNDLNSNAVFKKNVGTGIFGIAATTTGSGSDIRNVKIADFNNDGIKDFAQVASTGNTVSIYLGSGSGAYSLAATLTPALFTPDFQVGDVNGDNIADIIVSVASGIQIYRGNGNGTFSSLGTIAGTAGTYMMRLGDMNNDGLTDIAYAGSDFKGMVLGKGQGSFQPSQTRYTGAPSSAMEIGDFNNDGRDEALFGRSDGSIDIFSLNASGQLSTSTFATGLSFITVLSKGDVNGDGKQDLLASDWTTTDAKILKNDGNASFSVASSLSGIFWGDAKLADLNNDGLADIVAMNPSDNGTQIIQTKLNQGNGSSWGTTQQMGGYGEIPYYIDIADMNNDGVLDLVVPINSADRVNVFTGRSIEQTALTDLNLSSQTKAQSALKIIDAALTTLIKERANYGALHNRLDSAASANLLMSDSLDEARSKSQDLDIASETAELVRNQILQQAQIAVAAQANVDRSIVLNLLRFL